MHVLWYSGGGGRPEPCLGVTKLWQGWTSGSCNVATPEVANQRKALYRAADQAAIGSLARGPRHWRRRRRSWQRIITIDPASVLGRIALHCNRSRALLDRSERSPAAAAAVAHGATPPACSRVSWRHGGTICCTGRGASCGASRLTTGRCRAAGPGALPAPGPPIGLRREQCALLSHPPGPQGHSPGGGGSSCRAGGGAAAAGVDTAVLPALGNRQRCVPRNRRCIQVDTLLIGHCWKDNAALHSPASQHPLALCAASLLATAAAAAAGVEGVGTADSKIALYEGEGGERGVVALQPISGGGRRWPLGLTPVGTRAGCVLAEA